MSGSDQEKNEDFTIKVPFVDFNYVHQSIKEQVEQTFSSVYQGGKFILGEQTRRFEQEYADFTGAEFCVGVSSGLDALMLSLISLGIGKDDEVIVPSNTYIATALAVTHIGARPVFVEPDEDTFTIDPNRISDALTEKTKAIIPVHLFGRPAQMDSILEVAERQGLYVIEDNAQAQGACVRAKKTGSFGTVNATSFYPTKNLGALGDAGAITTNDSEVLRKLKMLRNYGSAKKGENHVIGFNKRLDELQAAVLSVKLKRLAEWNQMRARAAEFYREALSSNPMIVLPEKQLEDETHVYHQFVIRTNQRDKLRQTLAERGIETLVHYPIPPHLQKAYSFLGYGLGSFPIAEKLAVTSLSLPIYPGISHEQLRAVVREINSAFDD